MPFGRRTTTLLIALALVGAPAIALHALCVGRSCDRQADAASEVPYCSLPSDTRRLVAAGFREGRSPEILAVARRPGIAGAAGGGSIPWPALGDHEETRVPLGFSGAGVNLNAPVPPGTTLDSVAPTEAQIIGFERPFPEVRSGRAVGRVATGAGARLVVEIVLEGVGSADLGRRDWPNLTRLLSRGPSTMDARVGSLPADPTAVLTTIGTGGIPRQHGITGGLVRNDDGELVGAFSKRAPVNVISTLADDLDEGLRQRPLVGLVARAPTARGAIGGLWYRGPDDDDVVIARRHQVGAARELIDTGYGADEVPDLLVAVLDGTDPDIDSDLPRLVAHAERAAGGSAALVVTATGSFAGDIEVRAADVVAQIEHAVGSDAQVVEEAVAGGLFVNQRTLARRELSEDTVIGAMNDLDDPGGGTLLADTFTGIAVSFARYC